MSEKETTFYAYWGVMTPPDENWDKPADRLSFWYFKVPMSREEILADPDKFKSELDKSVKDIAKLAVKGLDADPAFADRTLKVLDEVVYR